ncbi:PP2C family serine/threonine-protein phosphatase [uncultured Lamprocystis sp.]|jgi:serine/threonine protein phosphatase PrpC|uniref:PP2C family serine/threonine-protein phosphatase n=1 Tax=uncultured Lamprocystis sp. TaxID=543132 RepID=UPI0025CF549E|nr:PP2C family serine/threonine-protein phosphatase [uncultured Lamprocystis sp.]
MKHESDHRARLAKELLENLFRYHPSHGVFAERSQEVTKAQFDCFLAQPELIDLADSFLSNISRAWRKQFPSADEGEVDSSMQETLIIVPPSGDQPAPLTQSSGPLDIGTVLKDAVMTTHEIAETFGIGAELIIKSRPRVAPVSTADQPTTPRKVVFSTERNASVGKEYHTFIRATPEVDIIAVVVPDGIGVSFDPETKELSGTPTTPGEHLLKIQYRHSASWHASERPSLEGCCILVANPDPQSLWLNRASAQDDPDWKPDEASILLKATGTLQMVAASKRGRSHAHVGSFRDDDFAVASFEGWNILAVADGAGSAKYSRIGSRLAVSTAVATMKEKVIGDQGDELSDAPATMSQNPVAGNIPAYHILGAAAFSAMKAIELEAAAKGNAIKDYSTTLILALHKSTSFGELIATFWVGDGAVAVYSRETRLLKILGEGDSGDYAGQTRFLDTALVSDSREISKRIRVELLPRFDTLALMTDGVTDPKFETDHNLASIHFWDQLWDELTPVLKDDQPEQCLLSWLDFWSPGNHDDRTIALLW